MIHCKGSKLINLFVVDKQNRPDNAREIRGVGVEWNLILPKAEVYPISATSNFSVELCKDVSLTCCLFRHLISKDALTDKPVVFL